MPDDRVDIVWQRSSSDGQVHAFPVEQPGLRHLALCSHSVPPAALEPAGHRGHWSALLDVNACLPCLAIAGDQLAEARGAGVR